MCIGSCDIIYFLIVGGAEWGVQSTKLNTASYAQLYATRVGIATETECYQSLSLSLYQSLTSLSPTPRLVKTDIKKNMESSAKC
jgi:hypothetical protein